jgi:1-acyl-sn-glycerol-3-phosphate acyltransferase
MLRAIFVTFFALAFTLLVGTPFLVHAVLTRNTNTLYNVGRLGARIVLWLAGVRLEVHGREKIPRRAVVFMANHQSNCDPPAIFVLLPPVLILGKEEFFRVPVLGRAMLLRGFVPVERKNRERAIKAVEQATKSLEAGNSFMVFPEGTRSPDGRLGPFKKGVFVMAIKAGAPIVPISVSGGRKIMPKGKFIIKPGTVRITFHEPVLTEGCTLGDRDRMMEKVRQAILGGLTPEEQPLRAQEVRVQKV